MATAGQILSPDAAARLTRMLHWFEREGPQKPTARGTRGHDEPLRFIAQIAAAGPPGPKGEPGAADYTGCRYWIRTVHDANESAGLAETEKPDLELRTAGTELAFWETATNLAEYVADSHTLAVGSYVEVFEVWDSQDPPSRRWVFWAAGGVIRLGKPTAPYASGTTITVDPCDSAGTDNGQANVTVQAGWTLTTVTGTALTIPITAIIPFQHAADGNFYAIGQRRRAITNTRYDSATHKLQQMLRDDWGAFTTTESDWQDIVAFGPCAT